MDSGGSKDLQEVLWQVTHEMAMTRVCGRKGVGSQCSSWWESLVEGCERESGCGRLSAPPLDKVRFPASGSRVRRGGREREMTLL